MDAPYITFDFILPGQPVTPTPGRVFLDVGDRLQPGIIDHHQQGAGGCATRLVLEHPQFIRQQVADGPGGRDLVIVLHNRPDLDAVSSALFAMAIARDEPLSPAASAWAAYVCSVDQGFTTLDPQQPVTPYSLFMARMHLVRQEHPDNPDQAMLKSGLEFVRRLLLHLEQGHTLDNTAWLFRDAALFRERRFIEEDYRRYLRDIDRAGMFMVSLPVAGGASTAEAPGLWIADPEAALFKSWCRGDRRNAGRKSGFVFTDVQLGPARAILSVAPDSGLWLKGLGALLEEHETRKRQQTGRVRTGKNRPGYDSPDPWYDGRSPLHNYTIVDAPRAGTILTPEEIREIFREYVRQHGGAIRAIRKRPPQQPTKEEP